MPISDDLLDWTATAIRDAVADRRLGAVEALTAFRARLDAVNPVLNAVCTVNPRAPDEARACDTRLARGEPARSLEGVPVVVKDNIETAGLRTTYGSRLSEDHVSAEDALLVQRLRAAGAVVLGKTNTPEFAADINTSNLVFGQTRNPWDVNTTPGGSSGGTAWPAMPSGTATIAS